MVVSHGSVYWNILPTIFCENQDTILPVQQCIILYIIYLHSEYILWHIKIFLSSCPYPYLTLHPARSSNLADSGVIYSGSSEAKLWLCQHILLCKSGCRKLFMGTKISAPVFCKCQSFLRGKKRTQLTDFQRLVESTFV